MERLSRVGQQALASQPFRAPIGARLAGHSEGEAVIEVPVQSELLQQNGYAHGGVISCAADNALTFAGGSVLGPAVLTSEYKIKYLRPASGETLVAGVGGLGRQEPGRMPLRRVRRWRGRWGDVLRRGAGRHRLRGGPGGVMGVGRLPNFPLHAGRPLGREFAALGFCGYRDAARHVHSLPYGRNSDRSDCWLVLGEGRGTCSTKHALLAELARENGRNVALMLGVYEMNEGNTPRVGTVLERHGLPYVPEAHCYLRYEGVRVDLTRQGGGAEQIVRFLHEEEIEPRQIGEYKVRAHKELVRRWAASRGLDSERIWRVREECIAALAD